MTDAVKIIGIDPATNGGATVAYIVNKDKAGQLLIDQATWPALDIKKLLKDYDGLKMPNIFRDEYLNEFERGGTPSELDFVRSAVRAAKLCGGQMLAPDAWVEDPRRMPHEYINSWIFGPNGEFTGFARIGALDDVNRVAAMERSVDPQRVFNWTPRHRDLHGFEFKVQVIYNGYHNANLYSLQHRGGYEPDSVLYVRFGSYDDYATWARYAAGDRTTQEIEVERY